MSKDLLLEIYKKAKKKGKIDEDLIQELEDIFPKKSVKIIEAINRGITKITYKPSNRVIWIAMGKNDEYLIYPKLYCSCIDFYKKVLNGKKDACKHIIAQIICEALNKYQEIELEDHKFRNIIKDLKLKF
ncbi:MAG: hypothetical protein ACTSRI_04290 [Promethearchaeota archaeon]